MVPAMELHPFDEVVAEAGERIRPGVVVHQQFSCASCGSKQTMDTPNVFYTGGRCEECGAETDIRADGCNYMVILTRHDEICLVSAL